MIRQAILGLSGAVALCVGAAADPRLCQSIPQSQNNGFFGLYYQLPGQSSWTPVNNWLLNQQNEIPRGNITFVLALNPLPARSGVVNVRVRTEALGPQPDASRVNVERGAVDEPCGFFGRRYRRGSFASNVPTRVYESYHNTSQRVDDATLNRFHFPYKPDQGSCVQTNAPDRRSSFRFSSIGSEVSIGTGTGESASGMSPGDIARAVNPPELDTRVAFFSRGVERAIATVVPPAFGQGSAPAQAPFPTHYTKLFSLLRKYNTIPTGQDCISFTVVPSNNEVGTYISITDFDGSPSATSSLIRNHWKINWQAR